METERALRWAAAYTLWWLLAGVVGGAVIAAGIALGGLLPLGLYGLTPGALRVTRFPRLGLALIAVGALAWKLGSAAAFLKTAGEAFGREAAGSLDTESMKSDILSTLDDRLADVHDEAERTRTLVERLTRDDAPEFEFED